MLFEYNISKSDSPFWVFAIHDGHHIHDTLLPSLQLDEAGRLREEDPYTGSMAELPINQFIANTSRFQLDINRKLQDAIYLRPEQAWGLQVWKEQPTAPLLAQLQQDYQDLYRQIDTWIQATIDKHGYFIVFDLHSYNAKRQGPDEVVDTEANPQINLGTHYNLPKWRPVIEQFMRSMGSQQILDQDIDIRENIKFKGGQLAQHLIGKYGQQGCVLSVEFRKDFMDEWTGIPLMPMVQAYKQLLMHALSDLQKTTHHGAAR